MVQVIFIANWKRYVILVYRFSVPKVQMSMSMLKYGRSRRVPRPSTASYDKGHLESEFLKNVCHKKNEDNSFNLTAELTRK